jgi:hypothetical protein
MTTSKHKEEIKSVPSHPAKAFFVSMLTRDIDLQDAILDLLDNCIDGAIRTRTKEQAEEESFDGFWAKIDFSEKRFTIEDNCGGIPWKIAHEYAFRMGRPEGVQSKPGTIGVVGIGMTVIMIVGPPKPIAEIIEKSELKRWPFADLNWRGTKTIAVPALSMREKLAVDQLLPDASARKVVAKLKFRLAADYDKCIEAMENYVQFYRHVPQFLRVTL